MGRASTHEGGQRCAGPLKPLDGLVIHVDGNSMPDLTEEAVCREPLTEDLLAATTCFVFFTISRILKLPVIVIAHKNLGEVERNREGGDAVELWNGCGLRVDGNRIGRGMLDDEWKAAKRRLRLRGEKERMCVERQPR